MAALTAFFLTDCDFVCPTEQWWWTNTFFLTMSVKRQWVREHICSDFRQQDCLHYHALGARTAEDAAVSYSFPKPHLSPAATWNIAEKCPRQMVCKGKKCVFCLSDTKGSFHNCLWSPGLDERQRFPFTEKKWKVTVVSLYRFQSFMVTM